MNADTDVRGGSRERDIAFGPFRLDAVDRTLHRGDTPVALGARAFDVLCALAARPGELVTKDELMERVWPGLFVEENNIQVQIWALRKALGRTESGDDYIVTVSGRGYRLAGRFDAPLLPSLERR